nr:HPF/RaiA family ribosome-associated protein [Phascolarctobacterium faecium]
MNVNVRGKNIDVTPALKDYVEKRLRK